MNPRVPRRDVASALPDFPWDSLASYKATATSHPDGIVDLSMGSPVDPVPTAVIDAALSAANSPGYPTTAGTPQFRQAVSTWLAHALGVSDYPADAVLPTMGSKEAVAWLPLMLGFGAGHTVIAPRLAYPTYEVGAIVAGCDFVRADDPSQWPANADIALVWLNSPSNPTGKVLSADEMRRLVDAARERGAIVASDECYIELTWDQPATSVLHPSVCGGDYQGLLALHSLSKRSNLAGYRVASITGDASLVDQLLQVRKHLGHLVPTPMLAAACAAYADVDQAARMREVYGRRRYLLTAALAEAGFTCEPEAGSLFIWASRGEDCWRTVARLAESGILVAPGTFYGPEGSSHVRIALTASDAAINQAVLRLSHLR